MGDKWRGQQNPSFMALNGQENVFHDFERFLQTENISLVGLEKGVVKKYYTKDYITYKNQISPGQKLPSFYNLTVMMHEKKIGHFHQNQFCRGPVGRRRGQSSKTNSNSSGGNSSVTPEGESRVVRRKRIRSEMYKMAVDQHLTSKPSHIQIVNNQPDQSESSNIDVNEEFKKNVEKRGVHFVCTICQTRCLSKGDMMQHLCGKKHRLAISIHLLKKKRPEMIQGMHGLEITSNLNGKEGTFYIDTEQEEVKLSDLIITNKGTSVAELLQCEQMKKMRVFTLNDSKKVTDGLGSKVLLTPGGSYTIQLRIKADQIGTYHSPIVFKFNVLVDPPVSCYMVRYLHARCTNSMIQELQPSAPYKKPPRVAKPRRNCVAIVPGLPPKSSTSSKLERTVKLDQFIVPPDLRKMINRGLSIEAHLTDGEKVELNNLRSNLESPLRMDSYRKRFDALLYLEEVQMEVDICRYNMEDVNMKPYPGNKQLLALQVPGLSENRPSVLKGDWLFVRICEGDRKLGDKEYQGFVHEVKMDEVALGFCQSFRNQWISNMKFDIRFVFNRLPLKLQHRACQLASSRNYSDFLFPKGLAEKDKPLPRLKLYNSELEKNRMQMCAVQHIVAGTSSPAPYIIFGPPGTGKTVTLVEAIKQVWKLSSNSKILACAPSNSAADLITKRLIQHIPKKDILRLNASSRSWTAVPDTIREVCNFDRSQEEFYFPLKIELMEYKIIVTTLVTAGRLVSASFPSNHFSHVFVDEGGHAVEPEAMIGISGVIDPSNLMTGTAQVVIAGDPRQLGPVLRSPLAIDYGLDISLLERLMNSCDLYQPMTVDGNKVYDVRVITKLLKNYRSHPEILKLPNNMFYDSELEPCANQIVREKLCHWEGLPKPGFPVVFHSVMGADMREERSPSFFNAEEVSVVIRYIEELLACKKGGINIHQEDIGIITPYRKQVQKIQQVLRKKKFDKVTVGSVEEFQGQERTVIIVSTVRSKPEYLSLDLTYNLGFLRNPKRFNVTVTRAKALLVVIGNPNTLSKDPHWKQLIEFCETAKSYKGIERMVEDDEIEDLIQRLNAVGLIDDEMNLVPEVHSEFNEQAWRGDL